MILRSFLVSEIRHSGAQAVTFVLCVALSIATLIALNSFKRDVNRSLLDDAQGLHGGDIILHSHYPFSESLHRAITDLEGRKLVEKIETYEFYTVIRPDAVEGSLFVNIKVVDSTYPFYGTVTLRSGGDFKKILKPGTVIVAPEVLSRLSVALGDKVRIGGIVLELAGIVEYDSTRPVSFFSLGPRVFVSAMDLGRLNLLGSGSRSEYEILLKVKNSQDTQAITETLDDLALVGQERVQTARTARSGVKRFFDNLMFFLSFISIFTLLLSGIGMQSSLSAILRQKQRVIAIAKCVGATHRFLFIHYLLIVLALGFIGAVGGIIAGYGIKTLFPLLFKGAVPISATLALSPVDVAEGLVIGFLVVMLFTFLPLYRVGTIKPIAVFRYEKPDRIRKSIVYSIYVLGFLFMSLLVIRQLEDVKNGVYFILGCLGLIGVIFLITAGAMRWLKNVTVSSLKIRQALKSLYRPGNATRPIIVTLASALTVLLTIYLLEFNLFSSFVESYPEGAPNLFCLDIQPNQKDEFFSVVGEDAELFPVIRARLVSINDEPINYEKERKRKSDSLAREFNLTYRDALLEDEAIVKGDELFNSRRVSPGLAEVSVLDTIADIGGIELGDRLMFNIQGVMLEARVTSLRTRTKSKLYPFFYFVFTPDVLQAAPQTLFAALHLDKEAIPETVGRLVTALPNVSTINVAETALRLGELIGRLAGIITFFALFSILAGCLILLSAVFATRLERIQESVYYKVLGAKSRFVLSILVYENTMLAVLSSLIAILCANAGAWLLCSYFFDISYQLSWSAPIIMVIVTFILVVGIGLIGSVGVIREKPVFFLRRQNGD